MLDSTWLISRKYFTDLFTIINVLVAVGPVISRLANTQIVVASIKASSEETRVLRTVINPVLAVVSLELLRTGTLVVIDFILAGSAVLAWRCSTVVDINFTVLTLVAKTAVYIKEHVPIMKG